MKEFLFVYLIFSCLAAWTGHFLGIELTGFFGVAQQLHMFLLPALASGYITLKLFKVV